MAVSQPTVASLKRDSLRPVLVFWGVVARLRLFTAAKLGLAADEAYYWTWSRDLAWGYYDHPPAIAGMIRLSTWLFGESEMGLRLRNSPSEWRSRWLALTPEQTDGGPMLFSILMMSPLFSWAGILRHRCALLLAWSLALRAQLRRRLMVLGVLLGAALLSKMTAGILLAAFLLASSTPLAKRLVVCAMAALITLPWLVWQWEHDWVSIGFQWNHAYGTLSEKASLAQAVGGQLGLVGPLFFLAGILWLVSGWRSRGSCGGPRPFHAWPLGCCLEGSGGGRCCTCLDWDRLRLVGFFGSAQHCWLGGVTEKLSRWWPSLMHTSLCGPPTIPLTACVGARLGRQVADWGQEPVIRERYQEAA